MCNYRTFESYEKLKRKIENSKQKILKKGVVEEQVQDGEDMVTITEDHNPPGFKERLAQFLNENLTETTEEWREHVAEIVVRVINLEDSRV